MVHESRSIWTTPWSKGRFLNVLWWLTAGLLVLWGRAIKWSLAPSALEFVTAAVAWTLCTVLVTEAMCVAGRRVHLLDRSLAVQMALGSLGHVVGTLALLGLLMSASQWEPFTEVCPAWTVGLSDVEAACSGSKDSLACLNMSRCFGYAAQLSDTGILMIVGLLFTAWIPTASSVAHLFRTQRIERESSMARTALAEAKLQSVRHQVNSHLVFNALNSILSAVEDGSERAGEMIIDLSQLLRNSLDSGPTLNSLGHEFERLSLYLRIEKSRFENDLVVSIEFPDELKTLRCLPMTIQPLVENAIKHGFRSGALPLHVHMEGAVVDGRVSVSVFNCGALEKSDKPVSHSQGFQGTGVGLGLLEQRLEAAFGDRWGLALVEESHEGIPRIRATVEWPAEEVG